MLQLCKQQVAEKQDEKMRQHDEAQEPWDMTHALPLREEIPAGVARRARAIDLREELDMQLSHKQV